MFRYALRDVLRNPRRTLASMSGVALAVGLFTGITFFVDSAASVMTQRAAAAVGIDMQAALNAPLAPALGVKESITPTSLAAGQAATVTIVVANPAGWPQSGLTVKDEPPSPLTYLAGSTALNGHPLADAGGSSPLAGGVAITELAPGAQVTITYQVRALAQVAAAQALPLNAVATSARERVPVHADEPVLPDLSQLGGQVRRLAGVSSVSPLGVLDLPASSLSSRTAKVTQPLRVFAFDPDYLRRYPMVSLASGGYPAGSALLSPDAAGALGVGPGGTVNLTVPGLARTLTLSVGGIADFSHADALFASRAADTQGEFVQVRNVLVIPLEVFQGTVLTALRADAASGSPALKGPPVMELDIQLDHKVLPGDPAQALLRTEGIRRTIERLAPGQTTVIDGLSGALGAARSDAVLAKVLFLFLGLPGVVLGGYLSRYAGGLLAQAQRRERATLRARGAQPRHLARVLAYNAVCVGLGGSLIGLGLGFAALYLLFGSSAGATTAAGLAVSVSSAALAGLLTTALALYLPARRALAREVGEERREMEPIPEAPPWMRLRLDLALLAAAAAVGVITYLAGGFKPTNAEGQSVSLSFYTLLAPLLGWLGATLLGARLVTVLARRAAPGPGGRYGSSVAGTLVRGVTRRSPAIASGVISLALAVAFGVSLAVFLGTYQAEKHADARFTVGSDIRVTPSALSPQPSSLASKLAVPGVAAVAPVAHTANAVVGTEKRDFVAVDAPSFQRVSTLRDSFFLDGTAAKNIGALTADPAAILISDEFARTFNIQPGDSVRVQLSDRAGRPVPVTLHAAGRFKQFPGFPQGIDIVGNLGYYQTATGSFSADFFLVSLGDPSAAAVRSASAALAAGPGKAQPLQIQSTLTAINRDESSLAALNVTGLGRLEALYAALLSAAGIAIFVFGLLLQRRKEYVTMRALGMRLSQLWALVLAEAGLVAGLGLLIGGLVGLGMAAIFVQILRPIFTLPPDRLSFPAGQLGLLAALVLGSTAAAAVVAGSGLRRLNPVELLREE